MFNKKIHRQFIINHFVLCKVVFLFSLLFYQTAFTQVQNANNYDDLIKFQKNLNSETESIVVWGKFGSWGKFGWDSYKDICPNVLNQSEYSGLLSALSVKLFSDSTTIYYMPIKKDAKIFSDFKMGDIIKLKVRLYRNCKVLYDNIYFLIEEIL